MRITTAKLFHAMMQPTYTVSKGSYKFPSVVLTNIFNEPMKIRNKYTDFIDSIAKKFLKK